MLGTDLGDTHDASTALAATCVRRWRLKSTTRARLAHRWISAPSLKVNSGMNRLRAAGAAYLRQLQAMAMLAK